MTDPHNPLAATYAEAELSSLLGRLDDDDLERDAVVQLILDTYTATWERKDGKRRLVLSGPWESDPDTIQRGGMICGPGGIRRDPSGA